MIKGRTGIRLLAATAMIAAATLAFGARPAMAATEGDTATFQHVYSGDLGDYSPMLCYVGPGTTTWWSCNTNSGVPLDASGIDCIQTVYANVSGEGVGVPLAGCNAQLYIPAGNWQGTAACVDQEQTQVCHGAATVQAVFSFQPVIGSPFYSEPASIVAVCTPDGGSATVSSTGVAGTTTFSMTGTISWVGSCFDTFTELTWQGQVTVA